MPDSAGHLFMVFDRTSGVVNPEVRLTMQMGNNFISPVLLFKGNEALYRPTLCRVGGFACRWGDYSATSYDGFRTDTVYFAGWDCNASGLCATGARGSGACISRKRSGVMALAIAPYTVAGQWSDGRSPPFRLRSSCPFTVARARHGGV
jgi:hypothetical protein